MPCELRLRLKLANYLREESTDLEYRMDALFSDLKMVRIVQDASVLKVC
jgi:hypothetical protein